jgi:hypothetical protein
MLDFTTDEIFAINGVVRDDCKRVFDWHYAARLIKRMGVQNASAGLISDWGCTSGMILKDGKPVFDSYAYLVSNWATPAIHLSDLDMTVVCATCNDDWDPGTKWPQSALDILNAKE